MCVRIYTIDKLNANISAAKCVYENYIFHITVDKNVVKVNVHNKDEHCKRIASYQFEVCVCTGVNGMVRDCDRLAVHLYNGGICYENEANTEEEKASVAEIKDILSNY